MSYRVELKLEPTQPALAIRARAAENDLPRLFVETYGALMAYLAELGEQPAGMPYAAYYGLDPEAMDVEIGFPVSKPLPGKGAIMPAELPGGQWAKALHVGPYDQLGQAHETVAAWIKAHGYEPAGPAYELYCSGPETPPEAIQTWLMQPVKQAS
jgi:effector-binding domain-containing protein